MRKYLVILVALPFFVLCLYDCLNGRLRTGIVAGLIGIVNLIVYW